ncbi:HDOD domain-containing protein [Bordetella sp. FB-8]|uniref:HDOD domain-containing protein n=1 Tax=Bordetella sp. FB-8 TaxID=1159870 RepID=UPI0003A8EDB7|nr:HDOD domain-containing protein [Bordetella sp. FB-8]
MTRKKTVIDKLWKRMSVRGDVPSLQHSAEHIIRSLQDEQASVTDLTSLVLSDFAFSQKVLRLANSAMYRTMGGDVTTVSRAIMVLGVDTVEYLGLSLQLLNQFQSAAGSREDAREVIVRAQMAAEFTRKMTIAHGTQPSEEAVLCTLMYQLSRLLVVLYLEDEWARVQAKLAADPSLSESDACRQILGATLEEIAQEAAQQWNLPNEIRNCMQADLPDLDASTPQSHGEWLGAVAALSSRVVSMMEVDASDEEISLFVLQYTENLALDPIIVQEALEQTQALKLEIDSDNEIPVASVSEPEFDRPQDAVARLEAALEEIREKAPGLGTTALTPWVVESIMNALNLKTGFMMLLHPGSRRYIARFGFGPGIRERLDKFSFDAGFVPDIFHLVVTKKEPTLWLDVKRPSVSHRMPAWFTTEFPNARSVLLVPVHLQGKCIAMMCGSWGEMPCSRELSLGEIQVLSALAGEISGSFERAMATRSSF